MSAFRLVRRLLKRESTLVVKRGAAGARGWRGPERPTSRRRNRCGGFDRRRRRFQRRLHQGEHARRVASRSLREAVAFASAVIATRPRRYASP